MTKHIPLKKGDRVELVACNDEWTDLDAGTRGIVLNDFDPTGMNTDQIRVRWDTGSWLMLVPAAGDECIVVEPDAFCPTCGSEAVAVDFSTQSQDGWWVCSKSDCGKSFEHRVRQTKTPMFVECSKPTDGVNHETSCSYKTFQGIPMCNAAECRALYKIA